MFRSKEKLCWTILALGVIVPVMAQSDTLGDVMSDLSLVYAEIETLKRELQPSEDHNPTDLSGTVLDRVVVIEGELQRLTAKVENLEHMVQIVARDGASRIGDLEWRICELDPNCDTSTLGQASVLGGARLPVTPSIPLTETIPVQLAAQEENDFEMAMAALEQNAFSKAADLFASYRKTYPGGPLDPPALVGEGRAFDGLGDTREAARRYLQAFSDYPNDKVAPEALWRLGDALAGLGSKDEACVTLSEVKTRYPDDKVVPDAEASRGRLNCP